MNNLKKLLYIFQLEGYDVTRFKKWLKDNETSEIVESKQKIKWTLKAKSLYSLSLQLNILTFGKLTPQVLIFSYKLLSFSENLAKFLIISKAKYKIGRRKDLIVIGITGSYGKTSVKEILSHLLAVKYKVLKTPDSYNTPLGISKIINQELKSDHQVFVVEMGAHQKGDIKGLCDLVKPQIGIITSIGKQHLERFGNEEKIAETKFEMIDSLPINGKAILNVNDPKIFERSKRYLKEKILYYGICDGCTICKNTGTEGHSERNEMERRILTPHEILHCVQDDKMGKNLDNFNNCNNTLKVTDIKTTLSGTTFSLITEKGEIRKITTPLLGKHNVLNIMAAINIAYYLNIAFSDIEKQCLTLEPIPHRLQLINGVNETTIIDDAFNANPDSARAALEVLADFPTTRKIIITPGLVELGEKQEEENRIFGAEMAKVADYIFVVGETNRKAVVEGIERGKSNKPQVTSYIVKNLNEAMEKLKEIVIPDSVILFENDLPDQYR